jgi:hypothetical protein
MSTRKYELLSGTVAIFLLLGANSFIAAFAANSFGTTASVNISAAKISYAPSIASSGSTVYVAWPQAVAGAGIQMFSETISNDGSTPGTKTKISSGTNKTKNYQRNAAVGNYVYVTWQYVTASNLDESIMFRASSDGGSTWGTLQNLSQLAGNRGDMPWKHGSWTLRSTNDCGFWKLCLRIMDPASQNWIGNKRLSGN